jgi:hypothetical protein
MKIIIKFTLLSIVSINIYADDLLWIDKQIQAIKQARPTIKNTNISKMENLFIFLEKNGYNIEGVNITKKVIKKYDTEPILEMIINKSALINGKWFKVNSIVDGYKINSINKTSVNISFGNKKYILSLKPKSYNLKIKKEMGSTK